ncbi:hypothetical protein MATL_G00131300 [Megalops atlanticus]|uniref:EF-hand domain-containing protein n=1 Tax=Megalops atlanticus TaxID=7932 RepID=A0A9D3T781_MEGAT|nr:hypothetical protein MATL_G00131300 [Megalops atlanticus]
MSLPQRNTRNKYIDTCPNIRTAGKLIPLGDRAKACLEETPRPATPPIVKKFINCKRPAIGEVRVFYGKADDPDIASTLLHGRKTESSTTAGSVITPKPKTLYQQKLLQLQEALYSTRKTAPLGKSHDQSPGLPNGLDVARTTFGVKSQQGVTASEIVNPSKNAEQVERENQEGHQLYIKSHNDYFVGERINRKYNWSQYVRDSMFGISTPHYNDGRAVDKCLNQVENLLKQKVGILISKRCDDFKERMQPQIGKVLDPIADTMNVPADHTFGIVMRNGDFGVGDLLYSNPLEQSLKATERQRTLASAVQLHLKKANFSNFRSLLQAFRYYDKKGQGWIDKEDLLDVCRQYNLNVSVPVLDSLMELCDIDKNGRINFLEFSNFLNWKGRMPINTLEEQILTGVYKPSTAPTKVQRDKIQDSATASQTGLSEALIRPEDLEPFEVGSALKTPKTLTRPRTVPDHFVTSSSLIRASIGDASTANYRTYGIPTVRTDLVAPRLKRTGDRTNYGDELTADGLLRPTVYSLRGVHEPQLFSSRPKEEIARIFRNVGVDISEDTFEEVWKLASLRHPRGVVCVDSFWNALKEIQAN